MFAITTRNKLRSRRFAVNMLWAWRRIRRQLGRTRGMLAYTTGMASLTEFVTLSLWEKEIDMFLFMSSEDHLDMMWNFRHWTDSFWSMRWNPTADEFGEWNNTIFACAAAGPARTPAYPGPGYLDSGEVSEQLKPLLRQIMRPEGPQTVEAHAVIGRIATPAPAAVWRLKRALSPWQAGPGMLRFSVAVGLGECMLVAIWQRDGAEPARALMTQVTKRFPSSWTMRFQATDFEVGHWDQLRLRDFGARGAADGAETVIVPTRAQPSSG